MEETTIEEVKESGEATVEEIRLGDVIDYQRDIAPYRFIEIHAGPGAGKNTLMEDFAKGEVPNAPKMRVLLITSRRAKADETFDKYDVNENESLNLFKDRIGKAWDVINERGEHVLATSGSTVCTSAFVAGYIKNIYRPDDVRTHLWEMYDIIAIDEAHSVMMDSTYQDAPFHIYALLNYYLLRCVSDEFPTPYCKHIILMTGTPDPLRNYVPDDDIRYNILDKIGECKNVQPQNIHFIENETVSKLLQEVIRKEKRCIYFANRISRIMEILDDAKLPEDKIVMSFSNTEKRDALFMSKPQIYENMIATEKSIKEECHIPDQFSIFFTTSRYREGINILDDIDIMVVESHNKSDVIQMAGRVRSGVKDLYIVVDAQPYPTDYEKEAMEQKLARLLLHGTTNPRELMTFDDDGKPNKRSYPINYTLNEINPDQLQKFIDLVEARCPYVRYNYLHGAFNLYSPRIAGMDYNQMEEKRWDAAMEKKRLAALVKTWFPNAEVEEFQREREKKYIASWDLWNKYGFKLEEVYSKEIITNFTYELSQIWGYKYRNKMLSLFSKYECVQAGKNKSGLKFRIKKSEKIEE